MVSFVILLCVINQIVAIFSGPHFEKWNGNVDELEKDFVSGNVESEQNAKSILEQVSFSGWAYCITEEDNADKAVGIVLSNEKNNYIYASSPSINRWDLSGRVPPPKGDAHGFAMNVSTILVSDGTYDVYLYCKENEQNYGIKQTQYSLIKKGKKVVLGNWVSKSEPMRDLSTLQHDAKLSVNPTIFEPENNILTVNGYGFLPDLNAANQNIYVCFEYEGGRAALFKARKITRQDVANYFGNQLYAESGFEARIPAEKLQPQPYDITILVEQDGVLHTSGIGRKASIILSESEKGLFDFSNAVKDVRKGYNFLDGEDDGTVILQGWAFADGIQTEKQTVFVCLTYDDGTTDFLRTDQQSRPDVADYFSNELYGMSGFITRIYKNQLKSSDYKISIIIDVENRLHIEENSFLNDNRDKEYADIFLTESEVEQIDLSAASADVRYHLEVNEVGSDNVLTLRGWAFADGFATNEQDVYLCITYIDGHVDMLRTKKAERPDVAAYFSNDLYAMSGFIAQVPMDVMRPIEYAVSIVIKVDEAFHVMS